MNELARGLMLCACLAIMNSRAAQQLIPLSATLNGQISGELNAQLEEDRLQALDITPIRGQLQELLPPDEYKKLDSPSGVLLRTELLQSAGIRTHFDFQNLAVELTVPTEKRRSQTL